MSTTKSRISEQQFNGFIFLNAESLLIQVKTKCETFSLHPYVACTVPGVMLMWCFDVTVPHFLREYFWFYVLKTRETLYKYSKGDHNNSEEVLRMQLSLFLQG